MNSGATMFCTQFNSTHKLGSFKYFLQKGVDQHLSQFITCGMCSYVLSRLHSQALNIILQIFLNLSTVKNISAYICIQKLSQPRIVESIRLYAVSEGFYMVMSFYL